MQNRNFQIWVTVNIVMVIAIAYGVSILKSQGFSDQTGISYVIVILFALFYGLNVINTLYYKKEQNILAQNHMPQFNPEIDDIEFEGTGLLALHISNLSAIYRNLNDGEVTQDRALDIIANRLARREYFVQLGGNIMITLGLIGTVTGLIIAITGLESVMTSLGESGKMIIPGLKQALSGMGTAFYTTLFGAILGGFFLKLMHQASSNMVDEIIDDIAFKAEISVLPFFKKTVEQHINSQSTQLTEYVNESRQLLQEEAEKIGEYMSSVNDLKGNIEKFNIQIEQVEKQMDGTHLTVLKQIDNTLKQIQKDSKPLIKRLFGNG
ncbi:MAG: MotA/TolQ/ExbB proton channel family protein [Bacteroidetes bacterium]|nr:MotA/TolQ/ExbB proton channel family protein [Bacteroidota bacterium]